MTKVDLELTVKVSGPDLYACQDAVTELAAQWIQARMIANPVNAQRGPCPDIPPPGLTIKPLKDIPPVVNDAVSKHRKNNFEEA